MHSQIDESTPQRCKAVSVPLLKHPSLSLVLAPGPFRRTILGWVESTERPASILIVEAPKDQGDTFVDEFDARIALIIGSATFKVAAEHRSAAWRANRC